MQEQTRADVVADGVERQRPVDAVRRRARNGGGQVDRRTNRFTGADVEREQAEVLHAVLFDLGDDVHRLALGVDDGCVGNAKRAGALARSSRPG